MVKKTNSNDGSDKPSTINESKLAADITSKRNKNQAKSVLTANLANSSGDINRKNGITKETRDKMIEIREKTIEMNKAKAALGLPLDVIMEIPSLSEVIDGSDNIGKIYNNDYSIDNMSAMLEGEDSLEIIRHDVAYNKNSKSRPDGKGDELTLSKAHIRKLGAIKTDSKANKFDLFFIKLWSYIVSMVIGIASGINHCIKFIFKKKAPDKYVRAFVSLVLIISLILLFTLPFAGDVMRVNEIEIYGNGMVAVEMRVYDDKDGYPVYKWGYANKKGKVVIHAAFNEALPFMHGVAWVRKIEQKIVDGAEVKDDYWYLIDTSGRAKSKIDMKYRYTSGMEEQSRPVGQFSKEVKLAWVRTNGFYGFINTSGNIKINPDFNYAESFVEGYARVKKGTAEYYINGRGKKVGDNYDAVRSFKGGLGAVSKNGLWGFVNYKGKMIIEPSYNEVSDFLGNYAAVRREQTYGIIDKSGKVVINPLEFVNIYSLSEEFKELIMTIYKKQQS